VKEQWRLSSVWGKVVRKGETLAGQLLLYMDERERERDGVVPHIDDRSPTSSMTGGARGAPGSPVLSH
jgi:hypothetical protein